MTYSITVTCVKSSILCLYLRIFGVNRTFSSAVYCVMIRVIAWGISTLLSGLFSCTPQGVGILPGRCINMSTWFLVTTVSNVIIDFGILVLPLPVIWGLQLSTLRKAGLTGIFLLGILWVSLPVSVPCPIETGSVFLHSDSVLTIAPPLQAFSVTTPIL